ncbi:MAG: hypothetical protein RSF40_02215 [Oscillospiraceae bacterium]
MDGWTVATIVITLVGFVITVIKAILPLNTAITELTEQMKTQNSSLKELTNNNADSHFRMWKHNEEQDKILNNHETRIVVLEKEAQK